MSGPALRQAFAALFQRYGPQYWWPAETAFEVMVGAILTQNTAWTNVERAIARLRAAELLELESMLACPQPTLAEHIRPAGYFNVKARRLHSLCGALREWGGLAPLQTLDTAELRRRLLGVNGIGPETADDILLYVFQRPVFVIDAYTRRVFGRMGLVAGDEPYEVLRAGLEEALGADVALFQEYHALLVQLGKEQCRPKPRCAGCPLGGQCVEGGALDGLARRPKA